MKHTPAPWNAEAALSSDFDNIRYITGDTSEGPCRIIASVRHRPEQSQEEALANAAVMKAAPDLLAALMRVLKEGCLDPRLLCVLQANQAIADATKNGAYA